ncbi:MAG: hypothetical protein ACYCVH_12820 [Ignavibacteriaceae bacterium]
MAKDPAFLFYSSDFLIGTAELTNEEVGQYIRILAYLHQKGRLREKSIQILVGDVHENIKEKFSIDENGNWFNQRLETEILKRKQHSDLQRDNVNKRWNKKKNTEAIPKEYDGNTESIPKEYDGNTMVLPLENENENTNEDVINSLEECEKPFLKNARHMAGEIIPGDFEHPSLSQVKAYFLSNALPEVDAENFWGHYDSLGWENARGQPIKTWTSLVTKWMNNSKQFNITKENNGSYKSESKTDFNSRLNYRFDPVKAARRYAELKQQFGEPGGD